MINRLHCSGCGQVIKYKEQVYLDIINSVMHQKCYVPGYEIKDQGTFKSIVNKYSFMSDFRINEGFEDGVYYLNE